MNVLTLAICGEPFSDEKGEPRLKLVRYAFSTDAVGVGRVKDANYVNQLVNRLVPHDGETSWTEGAPIPSHVRLFDIYVSVQNHGKSDAKYGADYLKYEGCPFQVIQEGMEIYQAIRKFGIRPAMKQVRKNAERAACERAERRAAAAERAKAEAKVPRFAADEYYGYTACDGFGHVVGKILKVLSVSENRSSARVRTANSDKTLRIYDYGDGTGEYIVIGSAVVRASNRTGK